MGGVPEPVVWLDEEEQRTWRAFLMASRLLFEQFERDLQRQSGMPMAYYEVLVQLSEHPDHAMRMSELADLAQNSRSRLSHAVARLEAAGWVRRQSCDSDRRGAYAVLTPAGMAALEAAAPGHVRCVRSHLFDALGAEQVDALRDVCETVLSHLAERGVVCPSRLPGPGVPAPAAADDAGGGPGRE